MKKKIELVMAVILLTSAFFLARKGSVLVNNGKAEEKEICIAIDAGHGGDDPGKIGINDAKEKDINLSIALKLKKLLEKEDIRIVLTRKDKNGLYSAGTSNKKVEDMQKTLRHHYRCDAGVYGECPSEQLYGGVCKRSAGLLLWTVCGGKRTGRNAAGEPACKSRSG